MDIKKMFYTYTQNIAENYHCDAVFEENEQFLCTIVKRNENGEIIGSYIQYVLQFDERKGKGEVRFIHGKQEYETYSFDLEKHEELPQIFIAIDFYIREEKKKEEWEHYLGQ